MFNKLEIRSIKNSYIELIETIIVIAGAHDKKCLQFSNSTSNRNPTPSFISGSVSIKLSLIAMKLMFQLYISSGNCKRERNALLYSKNLLPFNKITALLVTKMQSISIIVFSIHTQLLLAQLLSIFKNHDHKAPNSIVLAKPCCFRQQLV